MGTPYGQKFMEEQVMIAHYLFGKQLMVAIL